MKVEVEVKEEETGDQTSLEGQGGQEEPEDEELEVSLEAREVLLVLMVPMDRAMDELLAILPLMHVLLSVL